MASHICQSTSTVAFGQIFDHLSPLLMSFISHCCPHCMEVDGHVAEHCLMG